MEQQELTLHQKNWLAECLFSDLKKGQPGAVHELERRFENADQEITESFEKDFERYKALYQKIFSSLPWYDVDKTACGKFVVPYMRDITLVRELKKLDKIP